MRVERVHLAVILDLRWSVLRAGLPRESAVFDGDDAATAAHFAARDGGGAVIGCVTLHRRPLPPGGAGEAAAISAADAAGAWQLRGMAVDPAWRGAGIGAAMLRAAEAHVLAAAARGESSAVAWCNARTPAVPFYERHGWAAVSEEFDVPDAGPHRRMVRVLQAGVRQGPAG